MRIYGTDLGFANLYTAEYPPPAAVDAPSKKPFIILTLPEQGYEHFNTDYSTIKRYGCIGFATVDGQNQCTLTITSSRKIIEVIDLLAATLIPKNKNKALIHYLEGFKKELKADRHPQQVAEDVKHLSDFLTDEEPDLVHNDLIPSPTHQIKTLIEKQTKQLELLKMNPTARKIVEIEAFNGICYQFLLNKGAPTIRTLIDDKGRKIGIISRAIPNFQSLHDYYAQHLTLIGFSSPPQADLVKAGIGRTLAASYCEEESDLHGGNIGFDPILLKTYKIDHDCSLWPITAKYSLVNPNKMNTNSSSRQYLTKPVDTFPITQYDLDHFPFLVDAKPAHFPDQADGQTLDLKNIDKNPLFIKDVFMVFLKKALLTPSMYRAAANATISSESLRERLVEHQTKRSKLLYKELLKNERFIQFVRQNPDLKNIIINEFNEYNQELEAKKPLKIDVQEIEEQFDKLTQCINAKIKATEKKELQRIMDDLTQLDGVVGWFGGEHRQLENGRTIRIAKGLATIFDLYSSYKKGGITMEHALLSIAHQAKVSTQQNYHRFFNARQPQVQAFYQRIARIKVEAAENLPLCSPT